MESVTDQALAERAVKYWQAFLGDFKPCHFPPLLDGPAGSHDDLHETTIKLEMAGPAIQDYCSCHQLTIQSVVQTAWAIVIGCYAGVEDVSFITSAGFGTENLLLCRAQITVEHLLSDVMTDMMRGFSESLEHLDCSLTEIKQFLKLSGQQISNSGLLIQESCLASKGQEAQNPHMTECDILAQVFIEDDESITVSVLTRKSKFSATQTADVAHTMGQVLSGVLEAHPKSMISNLNILSQHAFEKILSWNQTIPQSTEDCFHRLFEDVVHGAPDAPAICSWDRNFTYHELDVLSTRLASHLVHLGVAPEKFVFICFNKTAMAYVSMLSILKAGGAFVAIDPTYPLSRIQAIAEATKASVVMAEPAHCQLFEGITEHIVAIDHKSADTIALTSEVTKPRTLPSNIAYAVFTSGSTGTPKGIMVEHRNLCTAVGALAAPMRITSSARVLQFAAYTFDLSYGDIFVTLSQGGCICVPSEHERINDLAGAITRMNVNTACLIPSVARMFQPEDVPCLRSLLLGGEALVRENLELWAPKVDLVTLYGPSECTVWCCAQTNVRSDSPANSIGRGVGALLWIANATNHERLCPIGCIGELLIEGPVMARGYLDAEQTKRSFIENPSWAKVKSGQRRRFYKTGDLAKYKPDGTVSFIGRKDTQIKLHGRRIEMGEIEYHLATHDLLKQSIVILPAAGVYRRKLVALLVPKTSEISTSSTGGLKMITGPTQHSSTLSTVEIKDFLSSRVPSYMVPQHWIQVEDIPLMISGKMNRVVAKKWVEDLTEASLEQANNPQVKTNGQRTSVELRLQRIWSQVFDRDAKEIGMDQDFFRLGGDSFAAMELVTRCKTEGFVLTVDDITTNSTVRQLSSFIKMSSRGVGTSQHDIHDDAATKIHTSARVPLKLPPIWWKSHSTPMTIVRS